MVDQQKLVQIIPQNPGVYKFFNKNQLLIYVGKAKNLRKRVSSYFNKSTNHSKKTQKLVSEIVNVEFIITDSEFDALLLENNLIKANQPKYNILLKDDKSFPYICVTNQRFPRVYSTRKLDKTKGNYFGPYTSAVNMRSILDLVNRLYQLRTCKFSLTKENIKNKKYKICLEHHIGNCKGPCEDLQTEENYNKNLSQVINILKGDLSTPRKLLEEKMLFHSSNLEFELAEEAKIKLAQLKSFYNKTIVFNPKINSLYVIALVSTEKKAYINFMNVANGSIIQSKSIEVKKQLEEKDADVLISSVFHLVDELKNSSEIRLLTNIIAKNPPEPLIIETPKIGNKKKLVDMALKNALYFKKNSEQKSDEPNPKEKILYQLQQALGLTTLPIHIECFDNSNIQGSNPVASMVCFKNAKPIKKDYRKFKIKTVEGPDDFASMNEVVTRRYKRLLEENDALPDLILIDGGKGQLSAAIDALKAINVYGKVAIAGIAKRLEEIYLPEDNLPILISKKSPALKLLQQIRDEAHRFAITFHRDIRSKNQLISFLDNIEGIGEKTIQLLLTTYKSPQKIKTVSLKDLSKLIGKNKATILINTIKKASVK